MVVYNLPRLWKEIRFGVLMDIKMHIADNVADLINAKDTTAKGVSDITKQNDSLEPIDKSYVARLIKRKPEDMVNISSTKLASIAGALQVEPWQLLHPAGFDKMGNSKAINSQLDMAKLIKAIRYVNDLSNGLSINDEQFLATATAKAYEAQISGDESSLAVELMQLSKDFKP